MSIDLREFVKGIIAREDTWNLDTLVDVIAKETPRRETANAYRQALAEYARVALSWAGDHTSSETHTHGVAGTQSSSDTHQGSGSHNVETSRASHARRQQALKRAGFRTRVWVQEHTWRSIQLCTRIDLWNVRNESERNEVANRDAKLRVDRLIKLMVLHNARQVKDLPTEIIEDEFNV